MPLAKPGVQQDEIVKQFEIWQERLLSRIRAAIEDLGEFQQEGRELEELAIVERYSIPDNEALNRILRYQDLNDRWLQRQRKGDYVPPPLDLSVNGPQAG